LQLTRAGRIETLKILPARCRCHHIELAVDPSRAVLRRRVEPMCVGAPIALPSEPRRPHSMRFFMRQFNWPRRILVMEVAPLAASYRGHFKSIARQED
jgi:hypothetical protein